MFLKWAAGSNYFPQNLVVVKITPRTGNKPTGTSKYEQKLPVLPAASLKTRRRPKVRMGGKDIGLLPWSSDAY